MNHLPSVIIVGLVSIIAGLGLYVIVLQDSNAELRKRIQRQRNLHAAQLEARR